jgi:hypothetical protein
MQHRRKISGSVYSLIREWSTLPLHKLLGYDTPQAPSIWTYSNASLVRSKTEMVGVLFGVVEVHSMKLRFK